MEQFPASATPSEVRNLTTLEDEITELAAHLNAATYRLLTLIREFDERHGWSGAGMKSCAHWLNWKCGIAMGAAREKVRIAHALNDLPQISSALRGGKVSFSKVRAMTRVGLREVRAGAPDSIRTYKFAIQESLECPRDWLEQISKILNVV